MAYRIREGVVLVTVQNVYLIVASAPCWDICPYITETNEIGAYIWNSLKQNKDADEIVSLITEEFETDDKQRIQFDVNLFIQEMIKSNYLIQERNDAK